MNRAGLDMLDADSLKQVKGLCVYPLVTEEYREAFEAMVEAVFRGEPRTLEFKVIGMKGRPVWLYSHAVPFRNEKGEITAMLSATVEITERKIAEEERNRSLREKEVLLKEIHHRVKNNMAIISALLQLQTKNIVDENIKMLFRDSQSRIQSMALVHEKLYQTQDFSKIYVKDYLKELILQLIQTYGKEESDIGLALSVDNISLDIDTIIPCALILNELVTNSLKHAFEDVGGAEINVSFKANGNQATLIYSDNGPGIPEHIDFPNSESLGLQIIDMLSRQLRGSVELERDDMTRFTIKFNLT